MSNEHVVIPMGTVSPKPAKNLDMNVVEMVFGTPDSPTTGLNDSHHIDNEKRHGDDNVSIVITIKILVIKNFKPGTIFFK